MRDFGRTQGAARTSLALNLTLSASHALENAGKADFLPPVTAGGMTEEGESALGASVFVTVTSFPAACEPQWCRGQKLGLKGPSRKLTIVLTLK